MREPLDMHAQGFPEPDDPEPVAGLSVDAGPPPCTRWTCTRTGMIGALREADVFPDPWFPVTALEALADAVLARLPEAPDADAEIARLKVCITHLNAEIADKNARIAMLTKGDT